MSSPVVAVTGMGMMTGLGLDLESSWEGLVAGRTVARRFSLFDPTGLSSPFGVELPEGAEEAFAARVNKRGRRQMTRGTMMAVSVAQMAAEDAGLAEGVCAPERIGVVAGATGTGYAPTTTDLDEHRILRNMASAPAAWISLKGKYQGPSFVVSTACSSAIYALYAGIGLIHSGQCDLVIAGAADSALSFLDVQGFSSLMALSESPDNYAAASRPFDLRRNGFVMGEGGGMLVLERLDHAQARGARIHALLHVPGLGSESYNIISPEPEGRGMARAMRLALDNAGLGPGRIDYVNAHGTSTQLNDLYETQAIREVFGDRADAIPVSSTKSMTGHCLSAAAGVEAVICCKAMAEGVIPPTANLTDPDPALGLDFVPLVSRRAPLRHVMCNSFAFGGQNGVCVFSKV